MGDSDFEDPYFGYGHGFDGAYKFGPFHDGNDSDDDGRARTRRAKTTARTRDEPEPEEEMPQLAYTSSEGNTHWFIDQDGEPYEYCTVEDIDRKAFDGLWKALRKNDPKMIDVKPAGYPRDYSKRLGDALVDNTNVQSLYLDLYKLCQDGMHSFFLRQIRNMKSLQSIGFNGGRLPHVTAMNDPDNITMRCFKAIAVNSHINDILLAIPVKSGDLGWLMLNTTQSLVTLDIRFGEYDAKGCATVGAAFEANQSLERLVVQAKSHSGAVEAVLFHLKSHPRLGEVELLCGECAEPAQMDALHSTLRGTAPITSLRLFDFELDESPLKRLLTGVFACATLERLALDSCLYTMESVYGPFRRFMTRPRGHCAIRDFRLTVDEHEAELGSYGLNAMREIIHDNVGTSICSTLRSLVLNNRFSAGLWNTMACNVSKIRLEHLAFSSINSKDWHRMLKCLPKLVHLQELELYGLSRWGPKGVAYEDRMKIKWRLLHAMRRNGSLRSMTFSWCNKIKDGHSHIPDDTFNTSTLQAYLTRNAEVPKILHAPSKDMNRLQTPNLMLSGMQAPQTGPNNVLIGLLAMKDSAPTSATSSSVRIRLCPSPPGPKGQRTIRQYFKAKHPVTPASKTR